MFSKHGEVRVERVALEDHGQVALARGASSLTRWPSMRISPEVTSSRPAIIRSRVDFPQPDGPTRMTNSPSPISSVTSVDGAGAGAVPLRDVLEGDGRTRL